MVEDQVRPLKEGGCPQPQEVRAERVLATHRRLRLDTRQHVQDHLRLELSAELSSLRYVTAPSFRTHPSIYAPVQFLGRTTLLTLGSSPAFHKRIFCSVVRYQLSGISSPIFADA